jgi:GPH family glycoside/pentoside/hexuronide:cation symporter
MSTTDLAGRPPLGFPTRLAYAVGAVANAVKMRGLSIFLMIFYNQVVGLPAETVGGILMLALVFDAFIDPTVGQISDNFRSKLGRRHPFMYAAAVPVSVAYFLLWNPPKDWSHEAIAGYLIACLLTVRLFDTFFELPHNALAPELAKDYHERTKLLSLRAMFTVAGGLGMTVMAYQVFLKENPEGGGGVLARDGYFSYSVCAALLIFTTILISTRGTQSQIPYLRAAPSRKITFRAMAREVAATLNNRAFVVATLTGMFIAIAMGARNGLELYIGLFFWGMKQAQLAALTGFGVAGSLLGVMAAAPVGKYLGKKYGAICMFAGALALGMAPIGLRLVGLMPPNGSQALFTILAVETFLNAAMAVATGVLLVSMTSDVIEDAEVKTGRRSEGLLLSADNLFKKIVSGMGILISGAILKAIEFPAGAKRGQVDPDIVHNLGLAFLPTVGVLYGLAIVCLFAFNIDKAKHEENLAALRDTALQAEAAALEEDPGGLGGIAGGASPSSQPARF